MKNTSLKKEIITLSIIPIILCNVINQFYCIYNFGTIISTNTKITIFSSLIVYSIFILLSGITKKTRRSILIISIVIFIFSIINQLKISYTDEPITFSDFLFLSSSSELFNIVDNTLLNALKLYSLKTFCFFIIMCFIVFLRLQI